MSGGLLISYIVLWAVVVLTVLGLLGTARFVVLVRGGGGHVPEPGPGMGDLVAPIDGVDLDGSEVRISPAPERRSVIAFMSAGCSACESALPELQAAAPRMQSTDLWLVYRDHPDHAHSELSFAKGLVISRDVFAEWNVRGVPYAVVVSPAGRVEAKGDLLGVGRLLETLDIEPTDHLAVRHNGAGGSELEEVRSESG
jgi:hypothetical protein